MIRTKPFFVYLASQSPRRQQLLDQLGVPCRLLLPDATEDAEALEQVQPHEPPTDYVRRVTRLKLEAAMQRLQRHGLPSGPVLCADTTVAIGKRILGKPEDPADACRMLSQLSGRTHHVHTALAVGSARRRVEAMATSLVTFAPMSQAQIKRYVATGEPMGKAGAYGIQGRVAAHVVGIKGSYSGIMGLPLYETAQALAVFGFKN